MSFLEEKICICLPSLEQGGAERRMTLLAINLKRRGYQVEVLVLRRQGDFDKTLQAAGVTVHSVDKGGRLDILGAALRMRKVFANNQYATVFSCLPSANVFALLSKWVNKRTRLVLGVAAADMPMQHYGLWANLGAALQQKLSRFADAVVVNSYKAQNVAVRQGFLPDSMHVIQNGVDVDKFVIDQALGLNWREQHNIPIDAKLVGVVARLDPAKGLDTFLQAMDYAEERPWFFVIIGHGGTPYAQQLKQRIKSHPLYGRRLLLLEDCAVDSAIYNAFDISTISSVSESFPNVMLEAMACGTPVVSTDVGDCRDVLRHYGKVVAVDDAKAMFHAWLALLGSNAPLSASMQTSGVASELIREYIISEFSINKMIDRFEVLLNKEADHETVTRAKTK